MKIGDIVFYVEIFGVAKDIVVEEVELLGEPITRHNIRQVKGKQLRKFSYEKGWEAGDASKPRWYRRKCLHADVGSAITSFKEILTNAIGYNNYYTDQYKKELIYIQKCLNNCEVRKNLLNQIDPAQVFKRETYISPFSGDEV